MLHITVKLCRLHSIGNQPNTTRISVETGRGYLTLSIERKLKVGIMCYEASLKADKNSRTKTGEIYQNSLTATEDVC